MKKLLALTITLAFTWTLCVAASADAQQVRFPNQETYVPLAQEPPPLADAPFQATIEVAVPDGPACTARLSRPDVTCAEIWDCPAGLSVGAQQRLTVPYNVSLVLKAASRSSHCVPAYVAYTAAAVPVTPVPAGTPVPVTPVAIPAFTG